MSLIVAPNEAGHVRVFSLSMTDPEAEALRDLWKAQRDGRVDQSPGIDIAQMFGIKALDPQHIEVFPVSDLDDLGLAGYLTEGHGVAPETLEQDRRKLSALTGWVLVAYSAAFTDEGVTLNPGPELTLIASYELPQADWSSKTVLQTSSARRASVPEKKPPSDAAMSGRIATLALLVLFALTAVMIWIAA